MSTDALRIGWTQAEASTRRRTYRRVLAAVLAVQAIAGLLALFAPLCLAQWLYLPEPMPDAYFRLAGMLLLVSVALYLPGWIEPAFAPVPNVVKTLSCFSLAILFFCLGGNFRWLAAYELIVGLALAVTYMRLVGAELMSRP